MDTIESSTSATDDELTDNEENEEQVVAAIAGEASPATNEILQENGELFSQVEKDLFNEVNVVIADLQENQANAVVNNNYGDLKLVEEGREAVIPPPESVPFGGVAEVDPDEIGPDGERIPKRKPVSKPYDNFRLLGDGQSAANQYLSVFDPFDSDFSAPVNEGKDIEMQSKQAQIDAQKALDKSKAQQLLK